MYDIYAYIYIHTYSRYDMYLHVSLCVFFILESYTKLPGLCTRYVFFKKWFRAVDF